MLSRHFKKIIFSLSILAFTFVGVQTAQAVQLPLTGWACSSNVGWISFNSKNVGAGAGAGGTYAVQVDSLSGVFSGYAWSPSIGWISFNSNNPADMIGCPGPCVPSMNFATGGNVLGFIRALSAKNRTDGWEGWIKLTGVNHEAGNISGTRGVAYNPANKTFNGYAWGSNVVGWVDFNGVRLESTLPISAPDLTAGPATPTTAVIGTSQSFTADISNIGTASTGTSFSNSMQVSTGPCEGPASCPTSTLVTPLILASSSPIGALGVGIGSKVTATASYTFTGSPGTRSVRFCADANALFVGTITETSADPLKGENNNCGPWKNVVVTGGVVTPIITTAVGATNCSAKEVQLRWAVSNYSSKIKGYNIYRDKGDVTLNKTMINRDLFFYIDNYRGSRDSSLLISHSYIVSVLYENSPGVITEAKSKQFFVPGCGKIGISLTPGPDLTVIKGQPLVVSNYIISQLTSGSQSKAFFSFNLLKFTGIGTSTTTVINDISSLASATGVYATLTGFNSLQLAFPTFTPESENLRLSLHNLDTLDLGNYKIEIKAVTHVFDQSPRATCVTDYRPAPSTFSRLSCTSSNYPEFNHELNIDNESDSNTTSFNDYFRFIKVAYAQIIGATSGNIADEPWKSAAESFADMMCNAASQNTFRGNWSSQTQNLTTRSFTCVEKSKAVANATASFNVTVGTGNPVCPSGNVTLSSGEIKVGDSVTASAPSGFSGGTFSSNNSHASVSGSTVTGSSEGGSVISGSNWTHANCATPVSLGGDTLTITGGGGGSRNGACDPTSNGQSLSSTPTALCLRFDNTPIIDTGSSWTWSCEGSNGGSPANCSAQKICPSTHPGTYPNCIGSSNSCSIPSTRNLCGDRTTQGTNQRSSSSRWIWDCGTAIGCFINKSPGFIED